MFERLFTPIRIGSIEIPNRLVVSPMVTNYCGASGDTTDRFIAYHEEKARGGFGLIITENYVVADEGRGFTYVGGLHKDEVIESHRKLTDRIHVCESKIFAQLIHCGRETRTAVTHAPVVAPSALPCPVNQDMPHVLSVQEIKELVDKFGDAALRAKQAGYDGVELNGAHGYLIAQFMSSYSNKRVDAYGGMLYNRLRFLREILENIRQKTGRDYPVILRISAEEGMPGGRRIEETCAIAIVLEEWGVDALDISMGVYGDGYTIPAMTTRTAWSTNLAKQVKDAVSIPVISVGRINDPILAESILKAGKADMISMGRASLADPALPAKVKNGELDSIRPCIGCMQGCTAYLDRNEPIRCLVNPSLGLEEQVKEKLKKPFRGKAAVVGAGPAGMEAARALAMRGANVDVYEERSEPGGDFALAAVPPYKGGLTGYLSYIRNELERLQVKIHTGVRMDADRLRALEADVVILASGSKAVKPNIEGIESELVVTAQDILSGRTIPGDQVVVIGAGMVGIETAAHLALLGRTVTVLEKADEAAQDVAEEIRNHLLALLEEKGVQLITGAEIQRIERDMVLYEIQGKVHQTAAQTVVLAAGGKSNRDLEFELNEKGTRTVIVGDAAECSNAIHAIRSGFLQALDV